LRSGYKARAPYDAVLFGGAVAEVPGEITDQLADDGRLLAVERPGGGIGHATLTKRTGRTLARRVIFDATTPLLPSFSPSPSFVF
jgi:protein-L-isoaspartate(D-aspartate) O-methyltransferase